MLPLLRVVLLSVAALPVAAAPQASPPDIVSRRPAIPRLARTRFVAQNDSRYFILNHHFTTINGLKLGVELKNRFRTGAAVTFSQHRPAHPSRQARQRRRGGRHAAALPLPGRLRRPRAA